MEMPVSKPVDWQYLTRGFLPGVQGTEEAPLPGTGPEPWPSGHPSMDWLGADQRARSRHSDSGRPRGGVTLRHRPVSGSRLRFSPAHLTVKHRTYAHNTQNTCS